MSTSITLILWLFSIKSVCSFVTRHVSQRPPSSLCARMQVWIDARGESNLAQSVPADRLEQADAILVNAGLSDMPNCVVVDSQQRLLNHVTKDIIGKVVDVSTPAGQNEALATIGSVEWILANSTSSGKDWKMIPAENLIVAAKSTGTRLAFVVTEQQEVVGLVRALEFGVDALCVKPEVSFWNQVLEARKDRNQGQSLQDDTVSQTAHEPQVVTGKCYRSDKNAVVADRVCVDLVQALSPLEGCWIGSSAKMMALVLSEAATSELVPSRPFRVNAGPVHSYILMGDGTTTRYLCELEAGDKVTVYNTQTETSRSIAIGRLKVEVRPCLMVKLENEQGDESQVFLQQAETVRLGQGNDERFTRATELSSDPEESVPILLRCSNVGTHVGKSYTGTVEEK